MDTTDAAVVRDELQHVYWIGGGSVAGKSTIANRLAAQHALRLYATDEVMADHANRTTPEDSPLLSRFMAMDMDDRWVNRSPQAMLETFHWFRGEGFNLIVEDLLHLPKERSIIAEGFRLLPHLVKPYLATPSHAVWLLPTSDFRWAHGRDPSPAFLQETSDPQRALRNLLERDRMFTDRLHEETKSLGLHVIEVDAAMTEDDLADQVAKAFGFSD